MSRIFDALRKAQAHQRPAPVPTAMPSAPRPLGPAPFPRPAPHPLPGAPGPSRFVPMQEPLGEVGELPEDVLRQMASLRVGIESALGNTASRTILILSSQGGEGASTVACQFAVALAREGRLRTLLVDFRAARPVIGGEPGWLARRVRSKDAVDTDEAATGCLDVLPLPDEARESGMFSPQLAREIVETLSPAYEWIVLDGPPALETSEAAALSALADGTVVVVRAGRTKRPVLTRTVDLLRKAGGRVLGTVLNRRRLEIPGFIYRRL